MGADPGCDRRKAQCLPTHARRLLARRSSRQSHPLRSGSPKRGLHEPSLTRLFSGQQALGWVRVSPPSDPGPDRHQGPGANPSPLEMIVTGRGESAAKPVLAMDRQPRSWPALGSDGLRSLTCGIRSRAPALPRSIRRLGIDALPPHGSRNTQWLRVRPLVVQVHAMAAAEGRLRSPAHRRPWRLSTPFLGPG